MASRSFYSMRLALALCALTLGAASSTAVAQVTTPGDPVVVSVSGNTATARISLPGNIGADLTLAFDSTQNLSPANIGISAQLVEVNASGLVSRLPDALLCSVPSAFPMLITIEPSGAFSFTNSYSVNIHTSNLVYASGTPLRIFKAPVGGNFVDITEDVNPGSVNTRGREGGFSQFLVVADLRPNSSVAVSKFNALSTRISNSAMPSSLRTQLSGTLAAALTAFNANDYATAILRMNDFRAQVHAQAGSGLANVWRATRDLDNAEGVLDGMAATLTFTLTRLRDFGP